MRNVRDYAIAIIAAIGFVSAVISLLTTRWSEVSGAMRVRRTLMISAVLIVAVLAAIASLPPITTPTATSGTRDTSGTTGTEVTRSSSDTAVVTATNTTTTVAVTTSAETTTAAVTTSAETTTTAVTRTVEPVRPPPPPGPPVIRDMSGRSVPQLIIAAQRAIDTTRHHVQGTLSSSTTVESDARLQGMITVNLRLDVTVTTRGSLAAAFTIRTRGGGFKEEEAEQQARERLAADLGERLRQEIQ